MRCKKIKLRERARLALELEPLIAVKAKEKQKEAGGAVRQKSAQPEIKTREELAKIAGVSHDTIHKMKVIEEQAPEEVKARSELLIPCDLVPKGMELKHHRGTFVRTETDTIGTMRRTEISRLKRFYRFNWKRIHPIFIKGGRNEG